MLRTLLRNLSSLILSLALAVTIWVVALNEEDPFEEKVFSEPIPVTIDNLPSDMMIVSNAPPRVEVRVRAPASVWAALRAEQLHVYADLTNASSGVVTIPLTAAIEAQNARVTALLPAEISLTLETVVTRTAPIRVEVAGDPAVGYRVGSPVVSPASASIAGPASIADSVSELVARVNLNGAKQSLNETLPLIPLNADGGTVSGVTVTPSVVTVNIPVEQLGGYRDVAVKAVIEGRVAPGYSMNNLDITPLVVTLFSADPRQVGNLPGFVETQPLDISDAKDNIEARLNLALPEGVSLVGEQSVLVQVSIAAIPTSTTVQRELEVQGLGPGLVAQPSPNVVDVILSGPLPTLDTLLPTDVRVVINVLNLEPGIHQVRPEVIVLPERVTVQTVLPATIEVLIVPADSITPTLTLTPTRTVTVTRAPTRPPTQPPTVTSTPTLESTPALELTPTP
jgi:YbbR domain-containing protein